MRRHNNLASQFHLENHLVRYPDELHRHYILADAGETQVFDAQGWIYVRPRFKVQRSEFNDSRNKNLHLERIRWYLLAYSTEKP
jgi:hypothetical protein